jgi:hypothetical protein
LKQKINNIMMSLQPNRGGSLWYFFFSPFLSSRFLLTPHWKFSAGVCRLDRLKASTTTGGTVCAKPQTATTETDVQVTSFGFTVNSTAGNWTVTTTNLPSGAAAWSVLQQRQLLQIRPLLSIRETWW